MEVPAPVGRSEVAPSATAPETDQLPPLSRAAGLIAAAVGVVHLVAGSLHREYFLDEAMTVVIGRWHLDWGAVDQAPVAPLLAWLTNTVAPGSVPLLRIVPSLATAAAVLVAALIARELGGDRRAQILTALAQATGLYSALVGHWLTPYTLEPLQWLVIVWLLVRWIRVRRDRLLVWTGAVLGLAAETRFQVILFAAVLMAAVAVVGPRELLRRPAFWLAAALAGVLAAPTLIWQALHDWPQLAMAGAVAQESVLYGGRAGVAVGLVVTAGIIGTVLVLMGLVAVWTDERLRTYRFLSVTFIVLFVVFVATAGRYYYLFSLHGALAALGSVAFAHRRAAGRRTSNRVVWSGAILSVAGAVGAVVLGGILVSQRAPGPQVHEVAQAWSTLSPDQRARAVLYVPNYVSAAEIDTADPALGLPLVHSGHRSYGRFDPPPDTKDLVVYTGTDPAELAALTTDFQQIGGTAANPVWLGRIHDRTWSAAWPELRTFVMYDYHG
ncbi:glycosyltransferase family 39 protein [Kibdelosporangium persicum]|uniref:Dolichyl-phosphate-mannose-protein mannosyltransferase n=1 Tax=Kibdelosporangium persicum TaxID=2698649 RepID=A0ABX2FKB6_9PSEU|nr:Dolichyl-phosphate-mannose-protein mannosyltransferase [Kibdelosporangium persicum]